MAAYLAAAALVKVVVATILEIIAVPDLFVIGSQWASFAESLFGVVALFGAGVLLVLWLLAPISPDISLRLAIARAALAVGGGAVLVFIVGIVLGLTTAVSTAMLGAPEAGRDGFGYTVLGGVYQLVAVIVDYGPVVLLATVLVWLRMRALAARTT